MCREMTLSSSNPRSGRPTPAHFAGSQLSGDQLHERIQSRNCDARYLRRCRQKPKSLAPQISVFFKVSTYVHRGFARSTRARVDNCGPMQNCLRRVPGDEEYCHVAQYKKHTMGTETVMNDASSVRVVRTRRAPKRRRRAVTAARPIEPRPRPSKTSRSCACRRERHGAARERARRRGRRDDR